MINRNEKAWYQSPGCQVINYFCAKCILARHNLNKVKQKKETHSYLKASTGFLFAECIACEPTVNIAINKATMPAPR